MNYRIGRLSINAYWKLQYLAFERNIQILRTRCPHLDSYVALRRTHYQTTTMIGRRFMKARKKP